MAVDQTQASTPKSNWLVGLNVVLMVILVVALVGGLQWIGLTRLGRIDVTSSGVNSLTEPTEALLKGLDQQVTLTSFYFETDIENEDQDRFRSAVNDLLELYQVSNRSQITFQSINPLQDHDERSAALKKLANCSKFAEQAEGHIKAIDLFQSELSDRITAIMGEDLGVIRTFGELEGTEARLIADITRLFEDLSKNIKSTNQQIKDALASEVPAYGAATSLLRKTYAAVRDVLSGIQTVSVQFTTNPEGFSPSVLDFLGGSDARYRALIDELKAQEETIGNLPDLDLDGIIAELVNGTNNPILVQTESSAEVVPWHKVWLPATPDSVGRRFEERRFQGEQAITSAILRLTQDKQPAVIFVRHGGAPMTVPGNRLRRQPPGAYAQLAAQLEDTNFGVYEWDLATNDTPPAIDPPPSHTLFVIDRPTPPRNDPFGQTPPDPVFTPNKMEALKQAMGDSPRALFLGGFNAKPTGQSIRNEYAPYLSETWGIEAESDRLTLFLEPFAPGKYRFINDNAPPSFGDHPVTSSISGARVKFPMVSSIGLASPPPQGVVHNRLAWLDESDSIWCVEDLQFYLDQRGNEFVVPAETDFRGEILFAATAEKDAAKIALVNSAFFVTDKFAMAPSVVQTSRGNYLAPAFPGNTAFFINILHWLNDNTEWMNLGSPIDYSTLNINKDAPSTMVVQVFATAVWPLLAAICGIGVYFARRR